MSCDGLYNKTRTIRFSGFLVIIGFAFASGGGCRKECVQAVSENGEEEDSNIVALVGVQPPRKAIEGLLGLAAKAKPSFAWINPKTMTNMALDLIEARSGFMDDLNPDAPLWFGMLSGKDGKPSIFGFVPLKEDRTGSRIMDRIFLKKESKSGLHVYETKSKKTIWWKKHNDFLVISSRQEALPALETMLVRDFAGRIPESVLEAEIRPLTISKSWDIELKEMVSMVAVFSRLAFLSTRSRAGNDIVSRIGVLFRSAVDEKMSRYARRARDIEALRIRLFFDEKGLAFEGIVVPEPGSRMDVALSGARPGRPTGEEACPESTYFFVSRREGWSGEKVRRENLSRSLVYILKPGFTKRKQERETQEAFDHFLQTAFGDLTFMLHGPSAGPEAGLGGTLFGKFHEAEKVRISFLKLVSLLQELDWAKLESPRVAHVLKSIRTVVRKREIGQNKIHEIDFVYEGDLVFLKGFLTAVFGKPILQTAVIVKKRDIIWAFGSGAGDRLAGLLDKHVITKCDLMNLDDKETGTLWLAFSLGALIRRVNVSKRFRVSSDSVEKLAGDGGVMFTKGVRRRIVGTERENHGKGKEIFVRFHVDGSEIHDIFSLLARSKAFPDILKKTYP